MTLTQKIRTLVLGTLFGTAVAANAGAEPKLFGKLAGYYDTRGKITAKLTAGASELPLGTQFFSFVDVATEEGHPDNLNAPYGEFRLSKKSHFGVGVAGEYNRDFSKKDGTIRAGFIYEPTFDQLLSNTFLGIKCYPVSSNNNGMQLGIYGNTNFRNGDITLDGYLNYHFDPKKVVTGLQVGKRIKGNLYAVIEGRYNGFQDNSLDAGMGLEWKF